ncbi:MAG: DUF1015 domain-containing protein [Candidatus Thermoplasmatota archaeon]
MVEIAPFRAILYNKEKVKNLDDVMSPPYDIISEEMQIKLYEKNPYNYVKIILGKQFPDDTETNNRYTRAQQLFAKWQHDGVFIQSDKPAIYPYKITFDVADETKTFNGFFVILKLDPTYTLVKAHEKTLSKPKADRLQLMRACNAHLEPIELLYIDKKDDIRKLIDENIHKNKPFINVHGYDGFHHKLWRIEDEKIIQKIVEKLKKEPLYIADGHHRYQTALNYAQEQKEKTKNTSPDAPFNYQMVVLANMYDDGLAILPTHRLIKMPNFNLQILLKKLEPFFVVEKKTVDAEKNASELGDTIMKSIKTEREHKFALYHKKKYYILTLKSEAIMDTLATDHSKTWRTLDVSILHKVILEKTMGITERNLEDHVKYTRSNSEAVDLVDKGRFDLSFLINATKIEQLQAIADASEHMPQKSTYFLPKMLSGLVIYSMDKK